MSGHRQYEHATFCWRELATHDAPAARNFYTETRALGLARLYRWYPARSGYSGHSSPRLSSEHTSRERQTSIEAWVHKKCLRQGRQDACTLRNRIDCGV